MRHGFFPSWDFSLKKGFDQVEVFFPDAIQDGQRHRRSLLAIMVDNLLVTSKSENVSSNEPSRAETALFN
jgi:hypothetical protein